MKVKELVWRLTLIRVALVSTGEMLENSVSQVREDEWKTELDALSGAVFILSSYVLNLLKEAEKLKAEGVEEV